MIKKSTILKVVTIILWILIGSGLSFVLVSGVVKERAQVCKEVVVSFMDDKLMNMIDKEEIYNSLWPSQLKESPVGKPLAKIDLFHLERQLEKNPWVESANLYVDNRQTLKIDIKQRTPVARVFTPEGNSFYLDESFNLLPLKTTDFIALPVFMNFYIHPTALKASDSVLLSRITGLSKFILNDPFWLAQIESIYIQPDNSFEITTQVGEQTIHLGNRSDWASLFYKLKVLYRKFSAEQSWGRYSVINLQYKDQVVCERSDVKMMLADTSRIDSTLLVVNPSNNNIKLNTNPSKK
ncbi:MAG: hypothetical protein EBU80_05150 [Chitinophagia bacterium]|nr:hypothetical protein [Chitinophagia bacterium]